MAETIEMAQDDHKQRSGNSSCGSGSSKSSKKLKQKKVPQRGLGVAQLEKIRLEEQQKKDVVLQSVLQNNNPILAPNFRQNNPPPQIDSNSVFKTNSGSEFSNQNPGTYSKPLSLGQGSWGKLWNGEHILEGESCRLDQSGGFVFRPNANVIYESIPPAPSGIPTKELFQPQNSSSSMVKVSSGTSSSSVITYNQMEPPSNQSFYSKIYTSSKWPEEEKMIGIKRPYPFSPDNLQGPAYRCKFSPVHLQYPVGRSVESPSCVNGGLVHVEPQKPLLGGPASLNVMPETRTEKVTKKDADLNGDFLTLALPKPPLPHPTKDISGAGLKLQENVDKPSFYSFFPSSKAINGQATNIVTSCNCKVAEKLDLNLKL